MHNSSPLQELRLQYKPKLPFILEKLTELEPRQMLYSPKEYEAIRRYFPQLSQNPPLQFKVTDKQTHSPYKVGVLFSGGPAAGGHNVISGLLDALYKFNPQSQLVGFLNGPEGVIKNQTKEISLSLLENYRNLGGFDLLGSGRSKIETPEQFQAAEKTVREHDLDGLVVIGGDDSNTNAALLAEYFAGQHCKTAVIGVPKTIDGDLKSVDIPLSFGFDTACKTYSEVIGNLLRDAISAKKYTFFIKLMGRSASHIALECAWQTHPNMVLIGEEIEAKKLTLASITGSICDMIQSRSDRGKEYGAILIPEGVIEFIPEVKALIQELNALIVKGTKSLEDIKKSLSQDSLNCFNSIPPAIQDQLIMERDPHGNVQVTKIETERLFMDTVSKELQRRLFKGKFNPQPYFCGYEGRSSLPSNFDANYCYALGHVAALLTASRATGYMAAIHQLHLPAVEWQIASIPLISLMHEELRKGKTVPVIRKALVDLQSSIYQKYVSQRENWLHQDDYRYPGPIQFFGPEELTDSIPLTLALAK